MDMRRTSWLVVSGVVILLITCCPSVAARRTMKVNVEVMMEEFDGKDEGPKKNKSSSSVSVNVFGNGDSDDNDSGNGDANDGDDNGDQTSTTPAPRNNITEKINFLLWTRSNPGDKEYDAMLIDNSTQLKASPFNGGKPTVILIHGWNSHGQLEWILRAKTEYLKFQDCNFIVVDWGQISLDIDYFGVALNVPNVAKHAAKFLDYLHDESGLDLTKVYAIGHSLGAHVVAIMGINVQKGPLARITGLDPAGPGFYEAPKYYKLDKGDATFVDVIYTNSGPLLQFCVGLDGSYGHVNFYPNGGLYQPGCNNGDSWEKLLAVGCNHYRAREYWIESINGNTTFKSVPCPDRKSYEDGKCPDCGSGCLNMGVHLDKEARGTYFLRTNSASPFAKG